LEKMTVKVTEEIIKRSIEERNLAITNKEYFAHNRRCVLAQAANEANDQPGTTIEAGFGWLYRRELLQPHASGRAMMPDQAVKTVIAFDNQRYEDVVPFEFEVEWMPY